MLMLSSILLGVLILVSVATLATLLVLLMVVGRFMARVRELDAMVQDAISSDGNKPSKLALFIDSAAAILSARIVSTLEASLRGSMGGTAKAENAQALAENPLIGLVGRGTKLGKSPMAVQLLQGILSGFGKPPGNGASPASTGGSPKFRL